MCPIFQSKDDTVPDLRKDYTLTINSASGGATISNDPGSATSTVVYVASDYPHGLFEFSLPEVTTITEDTNKVKIKFNCYICHWTKIVNRQTRGMTHLHLAEVLVCSSACGHNQACKNLIERKNIVMKTEAS